jgi:putative RecB family exonuclease
MTMITTAESIPPKRSDEPFDHLSFSALATFQACPLRFYFRYLAGLPEPIIGASLVFGSAMHAAVQFHFEELLAGNDPPDLDAFLDVFHDSWRVKAEGQTIRFKKGEVFNDLCRLADRMLKVFQKSDFAHPTGTIIGVEEPLRGELLPDCPDLLARVDLLVNTDSALIVSDFKTSRSGWSQDQVLDAAPQLLLYSEVAKELSDGKPIRLQFAVMSKSKIPFLQTHPVALDPHLLRRTRSLVRQIWNAIQAGHFYPSPSPINCPTCPFQKPCRAWQG